MMIQIMGEGGQRRGASCSYADCRVWSLIPEGLRRPVSRQMTAHMRRIAHLPRELGERLDERAAPFYVLRWVAWGEGAAGQRERFEAAMRSWEDGGRWPAAASGAGKRRSSGESKIVTT